MGLPNINIIFQQVAQTAIQRGERGIVALILKDAVHKGLSTYNSLDEMPSDFSTYNKTQILNAFIGNVKAPLKVVIFVEDTTATDYSAAQTALETVKWNYLAVPGIVAADATTMATWVKGLKDNKGIRVKAVLPHTAGDHETIINFDTDNIIVGSNTYDAADYCSRIAGLLAGTPLDESCTFSVLYEVDDVPHLTITDFNTAIDAGKFVLMNDGEKVKVARGINSLVTTTVAKTADYKKIKLVDIMDQINDDTKKTIADKYIGKFPNNYDNQILLITALLGYSRTLEGQSILNSGSSNFAVNVAAKKVYLTSIGIDTTNMKDIDVKTYPTGDKVFITGNVKILDAMEDFNLAVNM
jgi:hypothetical protein